MAITQIQKQQNINPAATQMLMQGFSELSSQRNMRRANLVKQTEEYAAAHGGFANMLANSGDEGNALLREYFTEGLGMGRKDLDKLYKQMEGGANPDELAYAARQGMMNEQEGFGKILYTMDEESGTAPSQTPTISGQEAGPPSTGGYSMGPPVSTQTPGPAPAPAAQAPPSMNRVDPWLNNVGQTAGINQAGGGLGYGVGQSPASKQGYSAASDSARNPPQAAKPHPGSTTDSDLLCQY